MCGRNVPDAEFNTPPVGYCRVCRRTALLQQGMPRPCQRCGRTIPAAEINRNHGYCNACAAQQQIEALPVAGPVGPGGWIHCPQCNRDVNLRAIQPNNRCTCGYILHPTTCPNPPCHQIIDSNAPNCNHCGWQNPSFADTRVRTTRSMQKRISAKTYETVIFEIIGAFLVIGLPFFGLPSMPLLAVALMALLPLYNFLPNESELLASRQRNVESLGGEATGLLVLKGFSKLGMFFFSIAQFVILPVSKLIPLAISFFYYFTLPVSYKTTQPFKMLEAWLRPFAVGPLIAVFIYWAFLGSSQAISLALMSIAFFCTSLPRHRNRETGEEGQVNIGLINGGSRGARFLRGEEGMFQDQFLSILFLILMALSLNFSNIGLLGNLTGFVIPATIFIVALTLLVGGTVNHAIIIIIVMTIGGAFIWGAGSGDMIQIIFLAVWELSVITGLAGGKESRPYMGILMILMTLFVFSFTATGVMGTAVFGYWWPQIASTVESITAPLAPMWEQVQSGMGDAWLILTNPMGYYDIINKRTQATKSVVKEGGTTKSIELLKTELFTSTPGELEPIIDPLIGSFQIQNQGEFYANKITADIWASWQDPTGIKIAGESLPPILTGTLDKFECSKTTFECTGAGNKIGHSVWTETTFPSEIRFINFVYQTNRWSIDVAGDLADCINYDKTPLACNDPSGNATYVHSGQQVKINVNLTYDYNVNVSIPAEVIELNKYRSRLLAKQITLQELTSQYTGGPVKATLWSQKQPIRSDEISLFVASIVNEGGGTLNQVKSFRVLIPKEIATKVNISIVAQTFVSTPNTFDGCGTSINPKDGDTMGFKDYWVIDCVHNNPMKTGEYRRVSFFMTPKTVADTKTSLIVGLANYNYTKTGSTSITIANAPWH